VRPKIAGNRFAWERNDIFVVPNFLWRRHINTWERRRRLYAVSDAPLMEKIGQYRAQGRGKDGAVENLVAVTRGARSGHIEPSILSHGRACPGIHVFSAESSQEKTWMPATSAGMTLELNSPSTSAAASLLA